MQYRQASVQIHLVARCAAWAGQARVMWTRIGRLCERRGTVTPPVRAMFGDSCGVDFSRGHAGGKDGFVGSEGENLWEEGSSESERKEGGPGSP